MEISVITTSYNRKDKLKNALLACNHQTFNDFELIVASDGSSDGTDKMIEAMRHELKFPVFMVHQDDIGYRRAMIANKAAAVSSGKILVFMDDDMIPPPFYLEQIRKKMNHRHLLFMKYLKAVPEDPRFTEEQLRKSEFPAKRNLAETIHLLVWKWKYLRYFAQKHPRRPKLQGGNFAVDREIFMEVNGLDCDFSGWGYEDDDLRNRLLRAGAIPCEEVLNGFCWNVGYRPQDRSARSEDSKNSAARNKALAYSGTRPVICENGINQLPKDAKQAINEWQILWP